jgi:hypothetical protein
MDLQSFVFLDFHFCCTSVAPPALKALRCSVGGVVCRRGSQAPSSTQRNSSVAALLQLCCCSYPHLRRASQGPTLLLWLLPVFHRMAHIFGAQVRRNDASLSSQRPPVHQRQNMSLHLCCSCIPPNDSHLHYLGVLMSGTSSCNRAATELQHRESY